MDEVYVLALEHVEHQHFVFFPAAQVQEQVFFWASIKPEEYPRLYSESSAERSIMVVYVAKMIAEALHVTPS